MSHQGQLGQAVPLCGARTQATVLYSFGLILQHVNLIKASGSFNQMAWLLITSCFKESSCNQEGEPEPARRKRGDLLYAAKGLGVKRALFGMPTGPQEHKQFTAGITAPGKEEKAM